MQEWAEKASWPTRLEGEVPDRLAEHAHLEPGKQVGRTSGSSSSPNTGPRRTGCKEVLAQRRLHGRRPAADHVRRHGPGGAGGGQSRLPVGTRSQPGPHPARHRRRLRRPEPPEPLLPAHPLRNPVEPEPAGAAERAHRPPRPEGLLAQRRASVFVYHFVGKGYKERQQSAFTGQASDLDADLEFLMRVAPEGRNDPGRPGQGRHGDGRACRAGHARSRLPMLEHRAGRDRKPSPCARCSSSSGTCRSSSGAAGTVPGDTQELRLSPDNIRKVVEVGLALAGQPALIPTKTEDGKPCFQLPPLKESWAACAEGLEHPHTKDIRPITFDEAVPRAGTTWCWST